MKGAIASLKRARNMTAFPKGITVRTRESKGAGSRPVSVIGRTGTVLDTEMSDDGVVTHLVKLSNRVNPVRFWIDELVQVSRLKADKKS